MSGLSLVLVISSVVSGLLLIVMVLLQQTSNSGLISNSTSHFAPGSIDVFKNKLTAVLALFFISNIISLWVVNNKAASKVKQASVVEEVADAVNKEEKSVPTE